MCNTLMLQGRKACQILFYGRRVNKILLTMGNEYKIYYLGDKDVFDVLVGTYAFRETIKHTILHPDHDLVLMLLPG